MEKSMITNPETKVEGTELANAPGETPVGQVESISLNDAVSRIAALESTNNRLLDENKKHKSSRQDWQEKYESREKADLEKQGEYKALYEKRNQQLEELKTGVVRERVKSAIGAEAMKMGCANVETLMHVIDPSFVQYDEESGKVDGASLAVEKAAAEHAYLFKPQTKPVVNPVLPGGQVATGPQSYTAQEIAKLPIDERIAVLQAQASRR
jgi:hypothetical protein